VPSLTSPELVPSLSPPWGLPIIFKSPHEPPRPCSRPRLSLFTRRHHPRPEQVTPSTTQEPSPKPTMPFPSPQQCHPPRAVTLCTRCRSWAYDAVKPRHPQAHSVVVLPKPATSKSPRCHRTHVVPEPITLSSSPSPQGYILYFSLSFWVYKSWFWCAILILFCCIALMCYIATLLWYAN
jgi:hypothetical protein